jgi:hypothetical protein
MADDLARRNRRVAGVLLAVMGVLAAAAVLWGIRW